MREGELMTHQVLKGVQFLLAHELVHEELSCAKTLVSFAGDVKICDVEHCRRSGDIAKLWDSFSRLMMGLMDKEKIPTAVLGLTRPHEWSSDAVDFFTATTGELDLEHIFSHSFMRKQNEEELSWLIPHVLMTARYRVE